jgi:xanthine dehydrogenase YagS FAD-binding subunit
MAPALIALEATIKTTKNTYSAERFFRSGLMKSTVLDEDEFVTGIEIPATTSDCRQVFLKFRIRKTIDFPIVSVASVLTMDAGKVRKARIALGGVAPVPWRATAAEALLVGATIDEVSAGAAGEAALAGSLPLPQNKYVTQIIRTMVKRAILAST